MNIQTLVVTLTTAILVLFNAVNVRSQTNALTNPTSATETTEADQKRGDIKKLIEILGLQNNAKSTLPKMVAALKPSLPQLPDKFWSELQGESNLQKYVEFYVKAYDEHFTHEEIKGMIQFYSSPLGKKIVATTPAIVQEIMEMGQKLGIELQKQIESEASEFNAKPSSNTESPTRDVYGDDAKTRKLSDVQKQWLIKEKGINPDDWDLSADGKYLVSKPKPEPPPALPSLTDLPQQPSTPAPPDVHYVVTYGEMMCYCKEEPKPYGNGFKFKIYPSDVETTFSGNIQIVKIK